MALPTSASIHPPQPPRHALPLLDQDVLEFVARQKHLSEFAFALADIGCIYVGQLVQMSEAQAIEAAGGDAGPVQDMRERLRYCDLAFGLSAPDWTPPTELDEAC